MNNSCHVDGCNRPGAFRTYTKPTWCTEHLQDVYRRGGLVLLEDFTKATDYLLTQCLDCGFEGHYRFAYVEDRIATGEKVCRACYWRGWAEMTRRLTGHDDPENPDEVRRTAEANDLEYLRPLTDHPLSGDPHATRCRYCGRVEAQRVGDMGWGCPCRRNPKSASSSPRRQAGQVLLFKDSGTEAVAWWDHSKNPVEKWQTARPRSRFVAWWNCPEGHEFQAQVSRVTDHPKGACPVCAKRRQREYLATRFEQEKKYGHLTVAEVPELAAAWAELYPPSLVGALERVHRGVRFRCANGHEVRYFTPIDYLNRECSACLAAETRRNNAAKAEENPLGHRLTAEIGSQWHPTKNGKWKLASVSPNSRKMAWWLDPICGHEFQAPPRDRNKYQRYRCPECRTILDSLAFHYPELADQWAPENPVSPWHVRPAGATFTVKPTWVCPEDSSHRWQASPASRVNGSGCPMCRTAGKSKIEGLYADAASQVWEHVDQGQRVYSDVFERRGSWSVDVLVTDGDRRLVIEYDGSYWHRDKTDVDVAKTLELLNAGFWVCRVREHPLPPLPIEHERYMEATAHATAPDPAAGVDAARVFFG